MGIRARLNDVLTIEELKLTSEVAEEEGPDESPATDVFAESSAGVAASTNSTKSSMLRYEFYERIPASSRPVKSPPPTQTYPIERSYILLDQDRELNTIYTPTTGCREVVL
jgi:hypothetical protein